MMNFSYTDIDPGTAEWAEETMEYLGMNAQEDSQQEVEEQLVDAPFRVRIPNTEREDLQLVPREHDQERKKPQRHRIWGIRRKTLVEVKTLVLEQMAEEVPTIQREINRNTTRAIFVENNSVSVLRPRELKYKYYEMDDVQFNLYRARVKEETEKDILRVDREKNEVLDEMDRIQQARDSSDIMI